MRGVVIGVAVMAVLLTLANGGGCADNFGGVNMIQTPQHPFGSAGADASLDRLLQTGAGMVAIVPFLWQADPTSGVPGPGSALSDEQLVAGIRAVRARGMQVMLKPHVWVPGSWAGAIAADTEERREEWFVHYAREILHYATFAAAEEVDAFALGTELTAFDGDPRWRRLIEDVRRVYKGRLTYVAHGLAGADAFAFWDLLDAVAVSLYPPLGPVADVEAMRSVMDAHAAAVAAIAARHGKPLWAAEIGLMSARGSQQHPWRSPEEWQGEPDEALQATVLRLWSDILTAHGARYVLVWRWFTDPSAGGASDIDFTIQGKRAEAVMRCVWHRQATCAAAGP